VIIPNKKGRKIITDLSKQTFTDYELIVVEDRLLKGQSWALNRGIGYASGKHLMFLDDDLILEDTLLEFLYKAIIGTKHSIAYCNYKMDGVMRGTHSAVEWSYDILKKHNYISGCSLVVAKHFPGWDESIKRLKDWDVWLTMAGQGRTGVWVDKVLFTAIFYKDGISSFSDGGEAEKIVRKKHNL